MKVTPLDIKKHQFRKGMLGYDPVEVDAFLEMVSEELEDLSREKNELADEALTLRTQLSDYKNVERTLKDTLMSAQESVKLSKESTTREAELILREAELKAEKILADAKLELAAMKNELIIVKSQKDSFARRLRHLLDSQLEMIQVLELDDLGFGSHEQKRSRKTVRHPLPKEQNRYESQKKIEYEAVPDVLPEQSAQTPQNTTADESDKPHGINWGKRDLPQVPDANHDLDDEHQQKRISDQLIT